MADDGDRAADLAQIERERAIATRQPTGPAPTGRCHHCAAPLPPGRRWCDAACRDDWERRRQP